MKVFTRFYNRFGRKKKLQEISFLMALKHILEFEERWGKLWM